MYIYIFTARIKQNSIGIIPDTFNFHFNILKINVHLSSLYNGYEGAFFWTLSTRT